MRRRSVAFLVIALVAGGSAACTGSASPGPPATPSPAGSAPAVWPPPPDAPIPTDPAVVASTLRRADAELRSALPAWVGEPLSARPPEDVVLLALYEQRVFGTIADRPGLVRRMAATLPAGLAAAVRANVEANRSLRSL